MVEEVEGSTDQGEAASNRSFFEEGMNPFVDLICLNNISQYQDNENQSGDYYECYGVSFVLLEVEERIEQTEEESTNQEKNKRGS